jgi:hypothetical protein
MLELRELPELPLEDAAEYFDLDPGPWAPGDTAKEKLIVSLAHKMLAGGLDKTSAALSDISSYFQDEVKSINGIINAVGSSWVDFHALHALLRPANEWMDLGVNGTSPLIARLYVNRAAKQPRKPWEVVEITGVAGENMDDEFTREIGNALKHLLSANSDEEVKEELAFRASQGQPLFVALPTLGANKQTMRKLRAEFSGARFFLLTGEGEPPPQQTLQEARVEFLEPGLQTGHEAYYCCQYQNARRLHLNERLQDEVPHRCETIALPSR